MSSAFYREEEVTAGFTAKGGASPPPPNGKDEGKSDDAIAGVVVQFACEIAPEPIEWLWPGWLAKGKLHLIAGAPEAGKTTIALSASAIISAGEHWPDGRRAPIGKVLIWTSEDDAADTIVPRLTRMRADLSKIAIVRLTRDATGKERPFNPSIDMPGLTAKAESIGDVSLLVIDPIVAAIGTKTNSHNNAETRIGLQPVIDFAEATNCAVIGITHFTKGTSGHDPIERVTGSLAFGALPRIVFAAAKTDEGVPPRIFVRAKNNIGKSGGGFGYDIDAAPLYDCPDIVATRIIWFDPLEGTARELLAEAEPQKESKREAAEAFLKIALLPGTKRPQTEIETEAAAQGISERTLRRAKESAKVKSVKIGNVWWWGRD